MADQSPAARLVLRRSVLGRRAVAGLCVGGCLSASIGHSSQARGDTAPNPERAKLPQPGDLLVQAGAEPGTTPIKPADVGSDDVSFAWASDPPAKVPRDGSRLNMILLMRFDPSKLGPTEQSRAADGVVAYSAICTHQQCVVSDWLRKEQVVQCPCHQSRYDLMHGAKVVGGPAPRPLPALPLKLSDGALAVAAPFTDRVGGQQ